MIKQITILFLISSLFSIELFSQILDKKEVSATKIPDNIKIDGLLDEEEWQNADIAKDFYVYIPNNKSKSYQRTEVKILYSDKAIYVGAVMYDSSPDSIFNQFCARDDYDANSDFFWFTLSTYNDGQNSYNFGTSPTNIQTDSKTSNNNGDFSWDAVWHSGAKITEFGWVAEFKIPYSALRFSSEENQVWGVNFWRQIRRIREISSWNYVDNTDNDLISQGGGLTNIKNITPPLRLAFYPYISDYIESTDGNISNSFVGGMDVKLGLSESFTLDMTLIPDFGQVKSDDITLNLSPYEVRYNENRAFFTEGTELFNKADLFYSRRIGKQPSGYVDVFNNLEDNQTIEKNPAEARLINATKISGRNKNNIGLGFFNAVTANTYAEVSDVDGNTEKILTEPFTNYNILVFDKTFKNNSFINLINTNVYQPKTSKTANVIGTAFKISNKKNLYGIFGKSALSSKYDSLNGTPVNGYMADLSLGKLNGNLTAIYNSRIISDTYDPNDMGYLSRNNIIKQEMEIKYGIYKPFWKLINWYSKIEIEQENLYKPYSYIKNEFEQHNEITLKNYLTTGLTLRYITEQNDYFESRNANRVFNMPAFWSFNLFFSSDYRKTVSLDGWGGKYFSPTNWGGTWLTLQPIFRISDKLNIRYTASYNNDKNANGYIQTLSADSIMFGQRDFTIIQNVISTSYFFNNKSSIDLRVRHYWSRVEYDRYYLLADNGNLNDFASSDINDINFNAFNVDLIYTWNFAPGSFLNIMWKNNIYNSENIIIRSFYDNLSNTFHATQTNSLSFKLTYYIDYQYLKKN